MCGGYFCEADRRWLLAHKGQSAIDAARTHHEAQLASEVRVPLQSKLATDALPEFLRPGKPQWERLVKSFATEEKARARERDGAIEMHEGAGSGDDEFVCAPAKLSDWEPRTIWYREQKRLQGQRL